MDCMYRLDNPVRPYAWGSDRDLPAFLGLPPDGGPQAELWMGAHPDSPSQVRSDGKQRSLLEVIDADPEAGLGPEVVQRYGARLPFLFKVLAAAHPLSLQVHPDKSYAEVAYAAQAGAGAAERDYTDDNHKPELICPLRDGFQALCGFRPVAASIAFLEELAVPELKPAVDLLSASPGPEGLRALVTTILTEPADRRPVIAAIESVGRRLAAGGGPWAAAGGAYATVAAAYPADPGVLVALLLNHAVLAEGEAVFIAAGVPHCYLSGLGAEIMASSDNVLRAGLTSKRVNVPELLRVLDFRPAEVRVLRPEADGDGDAETYPVPVPDFQLSRLTAGPAGVSLPGHRPQILLCTAGTAGLHAADGTELRLGQGESAFLPASCASVSATGPATILRATVGS